MDETKVMMILESICSGNKVILMHELVLLIQFYFKTRTPFITRKFK